MKSKVEISENRAGSKYQIASVEVEHRGALEVDVYPPSQDFNLTTFDFRHLLKLELLTSKLGEFNTMVVEALWTGGVYAPTVGLKINCMGVEVGVLLDDIYKNMRNVRSIREGSCSIVGDYSHPDQWVLATVVPLEGGTNAVTTGLTHSTGIALDHIYSIVSGEHSCFQFEKVRFFEYPTQLTPADLYEFWIHENDSFQRDTKFGFEMEEGEHGYIPPWLTRGSGQIGLMKRTVAESRGTAKLRVTRRGNWLRYDPKEAARLNRQRGVFGGRRI